MEVGSRGRVAVAFATALVMRSPPAGAQPSPATVATVSAVPPPVATVSAVPPSVATVSAVPPPVQNGDTSPERRAEALFQRASEAFDRGQVDDACTAFGESLHLVATLGTLLNLALCHEKQGKIASAWTEFTQAAAWANDAKQRDRREFAHQHIARLERMLPRIQVSFATEAAPTGLVIDREPVAVERLALPLFLDPGDHQLVASAAGRRDFVTTVSVRAVMDPQVVTIPPLEPMATSGLPVRESSPTAAGSARPVVGWIVGAVGLTAIATGIGFGIDAFAKTGDLGPSCAGHCSRGPAETAEAISIVSLGVGAAALAAGAWLVAAPRPSVPSSSGATGRPSSAAQPTRYLAPSLTPRGAGLSFVSAW